MHLSQQETGASFNVKINQLQAILTAWENGQNVVINTIESSGIDIHVNESSKQGSSAPAHTTHDIVTNDSSEDSLHADSPATVAQSADQLQSRDILLPVHRENVDNNHGPDSLNETSDAANLLLQLANGSQQREPEIVSVDDVQSEDLLREPTLVPENLRDEVDISDITLPPKIQKRDAWKLMQQTINIRRQQEWTCNVCTDELETRSVSCDRCMLWYHFHCASICAKPRTKYWFCQPCHAESDS